MLFEGTNFFFELLSKYYKWHAPLPKLNMLVHQTHPQQLFLVGERAK